MEIKLDKIKKILIKLPRFWAEYAFLTFLGLLFLALIFGWILLYKYESSVQKKEPDVLLTPLKFREDAFQRILKEWEEREKRFKEAGFKEYPNFFQKLLPETATSTPS